MSGLQEFFKNRVVVITGAGRGIGRSHALAFAAVGAKIVVNDLGVTYSGEREAASPADMVTDEIRRSGGQAVADYNDVADWNGAEALLQMALRVYGHVDVLVNNAAIIRPSAFTETSERDFDEVLRVNLKGTFCPSLVFARHWIRQVGSGGKVDASIICTTSRIGLRGTPYYLVYGCTKAAVAYLVQAAAAELAEHGIRVNGIAPRAGTRMMEDATRRLMEVAGDKGLRAVFGTGEDAPAARLSKETPDSISPFVVWLASGLSKPINGRVFSVMGGRIATFEGWRERPAVTLPEQHTAEDVERTLGAILRENN